MLHQGQCAGTSLPCSGTGATKPSVKWTLAETVHGGPAISTSPALKEPVTGGLLHEPEWDGVRAPG